MRTTIGIIAASRTEYERQYMALKRELWRLDGRCSLCGHEPRPGMKTCQACADKCSAANRRMQARRTGGR